VSSVEQTFGNLDKSISLLERAVALDPLHTIALADLASRYTRAGRYEEAFEIFRKLMVLQPEELWIGKGMARTYLQMGNLESALAEVSKLPDDYARSERGQILFLLGRKEEAYAISSEFLQGPTQEQPFTKAVIHAWQGNKDSAFEFLDIAFEQRDSRLANIFTYPPLRLLESDPRYAAFLEKLGLHEAWKVMTAD
jgi:predicted Zn-dependent protease